MLCPHALDFGDHVEIAARLDLGAFDVRRTAIFPSVIATDFERIDMLVDPCLADLDFRAAEDADALVGIEHPHPLIARQRPARRDDNGFVYRLAHESEAKPR